MGFELKPHQQANIQTLVAALSKYGGALDASDTGTGKTFTALGLCKQLGARPAIVTRRAIVPSWERAAKMVGVEPVFITNYEQCRTKGFKWGRVGVGPRGGKRYEWTVPEARTIFIFDESQALRSHGSLQTTVALAAKRQFKTLLLSATPFQTPLEAYAHGIITGLFADFSYWRWLFDHGVKKNYFGQFYFTGDKDPERGQKMMAKVHAALFPERGCRTRREEIPGFPETYMTCEAIETGHADEITRAIKAQIDALREEDHAKACQDVDPEFHDLVEALPITKLLRARQEAEALKAKAIAEMAQMEAEKGRSVAIFVNFDATVELLREYLDCEYIIRSETKTCKHGNRAAVSLAFQWNKTPYVIVNTAAGGAGLSLHDERTHRPRTALISPPYSAVMLRQVLGRVHRLGGAESTQRLLFAAGTEEERVMERVQNRMGNLDALLDSDVVIRS